MKILFIQVSDDVYSSFYKNWTCVTGFVIQGHIYDHFIEDIANLLAYTLSPV